MNNFRYTILGIILLVSYIIDCKAQDTIIRQIREKRPFYTQIGTSFSLGISYFDFNELNQYLQKNNVSELKGSLRSGNFRLYMGNETTLFLGQLKIFGTFSRDSIDSKIYPSISGWQLGGSAVRRFINTNHWNSYVSIGFNQAYYTLNFLDNRNISTLNSLFSNTRNNQSFSIQNNRVLNLQVGLMISYKTNWFKQLLKAKECNVGADLFYDFALNNNNVWLFNGSANANMPVVGVPQINVKNFTFNIHIMFLFNRKVNNL